MKASMCLNYTTRSLVRGGQRTLLAIFCVAIGVLAVVSLQLVGLMLRNSLTDNVRATNGGDIAVSTPGTPLKQGDLAFFDQLKSAGTISNYTAIIGASGGLVSGATSIQTFSVNAVDPEAYPLVSQPMFVTPGNGSVAHLLTNGQVIVTQDFLDRYQKRPGDTLPLYIKTSFGSGETLRVKIAGVVANSGIFAQAGNLLLIAQQDYLATAPATLESYSQVVVTTADQAHTDAALKAIKAQFPLANTQTAADVLKSEQSTTDLMNKFLEIAGLMALLIGGVGIINTMQVLLSRRKTEIAMLKTAGYRRRDLFLLFGLEAGLLGLVGGIIGAAVATGVSYVVRGLIENLGFNIAFEVHIEVLFSGVAIGFVTALIFGLLPIVQAASVRPLHVIREVAAKNGAGRVVTLVLVLVLSLLFCLLAASILNGDVLLGAIVTYGAFTNLLLLSGFFSLLVFGLSKLPVPDRWQLKSVVVTLGGVAISALVSLWLPVFGLFLLAAVLLNALIVFLPSSWKVSVKMALRNLGRRRARVVTTMLALFIGIYGIGLIIGTGQDVLAGTSSVVNQNAAYNLVATTTGQESSALRTHLADMPGLTSHREDPFVVAQPRSIDGRSIQQVLGNSVQSEIGYLGGLEGYDLTQHVPSITIEEGRNLTAFDATTNNVLVSNILTNHGWFPMGIKLGSVITLASADGKTQRTVTVVGIISIATSYENLGDVLATAQLVHTLSAGSTTNTTVFYMKVPSAQLNAALRMLEQIAPNAQEQNLTDGATAFLQEFSRILNMLVAIALLSVLAGVIIIANAVALAMLERRRELGILKSVGYTSGMVLREILIENGLIGGVSAFIAMLLAASGVAISSKLFLGTSFDMQAPVVVALIVSPVVLAMLTAALVAWRSVRVRPLAVLRYE